MSEDNKEKIRELWKKSDKLIAELKQAKELTKKAHKESKLFAEICRRKSAEINEINKEITELK